MRRKMRRPWTVAALILAFVFALSACDAVGGTGNPQGGATARPTATAAPTPTPAPPTELEILLPAPAGGVHAGALQQVLDEFAKRAGSLNVRPHFTFASPDSVARQAALQLTAGQPLDCVSLRRGAEAGIESLSAEGKLEPLEALLSGGKYPALQRAFDEQFLAANRFPGADGSSHLYGLPLAQTYAPGAAVYYRKDLAGQAGVAEIQSYDDLVKFLQSVAGAGGLTPFAWPGAQSALSDYLPGLQAQTAAAGGSAVIDGVPVFVGAGGSVYGAKNIVPGRDEGYVALDAAAGKDPLAGYKLARQWYDKNYVEKAVVTRTDALGLFIQGKAAACPGNVVSYGEIESALASAVPGAALGCFIADAGLRAGTAGSVAADFRAEGFLSLPAASANQENMLAFLDWLYADRANHDLFELGVPGMHWNEGAEGTYTPVGGADGYNFPAEAFTWNPTMVRVPDLLPDNVAEAVGRLSDPALLRPDPLAGFVFSEAAVADAVKKLAPLNAARLALGNGTIGDYGTELTKLQALYDAAGYQKVRDEVVRQATAYLAEHPAGSD